MIKFEDIPNYYFDIDNGVVSCYNANGRKLKLLRDDSFCLSIKGIKKSVQARKVLYCVKNKITKYYSLNRGQMTRIHWKEAKQNAYRGDDNQLHYNYNSKIWRKYRASEIDYIKRNYPHFHDEEIAEELDLSVHVIRRIANKMLGIRKSKEFTKKKRAENKLLKQATKKTK